MNEPRDPRPGQRFPLGPPYARDAGEPAGPQDPRPAEPFATELASRPLADAPPDVGERALEASLARPRRRRWGLLALLGGSLGLGAVEAGGTLYAASLGGDWMAGAWSLLLLLALGLGGSALARSEEHTSELQSR